MTCPTTGTKYLKIVGPSIYCVADCAADGHYYNLPNNSCGACHSSCYTCSGSSFNQCITCPTTGTIYKKTIEGYTLCVTDCTLVDGYYNDIPNKVCGVCDASCKKCSGPNSNQCTECFDDFFVNASNKCESLKCESYVEWSSTVNYNIGNKVHSFGKVYIAKKVNCGL